MGLNTADSNELNTSFLDVMPVQAFRSPTRDYTVAHEKRDDRLGTKYCSDRKCC